MTKGQFSISFVCLFANSLEDEFQCKILSHLINEEPESRVRLTSTPAPTLSN